jgi:hypothetical protein
MLKAIALAGFFFTASAFTPPVGASAQPAKAKTTVTAPTAPVPHGLCPSHC